MIRVDLSGIKCDGENGNCFSPTYLMQDLALLMHSFGMVSQLPILRSAKNMERL